MKAEQEGPTPRTPRAEVRRRLLAAATEVFAERGYVDSRLDDIAHTAGFTKGAIYSNFGSKQGLFGAVLGERAEEERVTLLKELRDDPASVPGQAARVITRRVVDDPERGQLGLEFAARAARDEQVRDVLTQLRRTQRDAAATSIAEVTAHSGLRLTVAPEVAALILHCLTNGLSMEHLADPEQVDAEAVESAIATTIAALTVPPEQD
ncbi:TetR/AcrR family transcriptional regulator [Amycolatopsis taiwanensis]|uniref:TetR/AcrR family transcriptional regulator n=1 Tax=Amycolatopsis taiwanensis TaxID=342230 RepID=UPI0004876243|nr:TetR/AcrR family transcriptional regulator [Amycolatopsis taiwanensis]